MAPTPLPPQRSEVRIPSPGGSCLPRDSLEAGTAPRMTLCLLGPVASFGRQVPRAEGDRVRICKNERISWKITNFYFWLDLKVPESQDRGRKNAN